MSMEEKHPHLGKAAKYVLGQHRGPLPAQQGVDGAALEEVDTADTITLEKVKRTRTQNLRRHWARFWCCYTFWSVIFLAIFLPIFFLICIPAIAQRVLDNSTLLLTEADILDPTPTSVRMTIKSALKLPIGVPVKIDPIDLNLFNRDSAGGNGTWAILDINGTTISGNTTLGVTNQYTPLDAANWQEYVNNVVFQEHARLSVYGKTTSYIGQLKAKVTMNKDIPQTTLNNFAGFSITDSTILLKEKTGPNLLANCTLPNPSVLTLDIGTTLLDLYAGNLLIGNVTLDDLYLKPGNHSTPVKGYINLATLIGNLKSVLSTEASALQNGKLALKIKGREVHNKGVELPYYTNVMRNLTLDAQIPLGGLLANTLHGVLYENGTNVFANLNLTEPEGGTSALQQIINDNKKRALVLDHLDKLS